MGAITLDSITVTPLRRIPTPGGDVLHGMKTMDSGYSGFGEVYFSWVEASAVKAWKRHLAMTMNLIVPVGQVKFVFYLEAGHQFRVEEIGCDTYCRLTVPPGIWFGFMGLVQPQSLVVNVANLSHDPSEVERRELAAIQYAW